MDFKRNLGALNIEVVVTHLQIRYKQRHIVTSVSYLYPIEPVFDHVTLLAPYQSNILP
jgi:hypothetical protein